MWTPSGERVIETIQVGDDVLAEDPLTGQQLPLGSGMIESACKWLIQQRFKGVGMRWSESGFNNLLILRIAWVNGSFDPLFPHVTLPVHPHSPIS